MVYIFINDNIFVTMPCIWAELELYKWGVNIDENI